MNIAIELIEEWKEINGYKISNYGIVINKKGYKLKGHINNGYNTMNASLGEPYGVVRGLHRIVAIAFIPNKPQVNHIDGNKLNNRADNLEWVTKKENQWHASHVLNKRTGSDCHLAVLSDELVMEIYEVCKNTDLSYIEIAKMFNISPDTPCKIATGYTWKYLNLKPLKRKDKKIKGIHVETNEIVRYESARFATKDGFDLSAISSCCTGKTKSGIHMKYKWSYDFDDIKN